MINDEYLDALAITYTNDPCNERALKHSVSVCHFNGMLFDEIASLRGAEILLTLIRYTSLCSELPGKVE